MVVFSYFVLKRHMLLINKSVYINSIISASIAIKKGQIGKTYLALDQFKKTFII